jgi:hypothetical protein
VIGIKEYNTNLHPTLVWTRDGSGLLLPYLTRPAGIRARLVTQRKNFDPIQPNPTRPFAGSDEGQIKRQLSFFDVLIQIAGISNCTVTVKSMKNRPLNQYSTKF